MWSKIVEKVKDAVVAAWNWSIAEVWRHWATHFVIAFALSWVVGAWAAAVFYVLMGLQDMILDFAFDHYSGSVKGELIHKAGDIGFPALAAFIAHVGFGK